MTGTHESPANDCRATGFQEKRNPSVLELFDLSARYHQKGVDLPPDRGGFRLCSSGVSGGVGLLVG